MGEFRVVYNILNGFWRTDLLLCILVLDLMKTNPFPDAPPTYVRAQLYHYHYTKSTAAGKSPKAWWKRTLQKTYVPPVSQDSEQLIEFLKYHKMLPMVSLVLCWWNIYILISCHYQGLIQANFDSDLQKENS